MFSFIRSFFKSNKISELVSTNEIDPIVKKKLDEIDILEKKYRNEFKLGDVVKYKGIESPKMSIVFIEYPSWDDYDGGNYYDIKFGHLTLHYFDNNNRLVELENVKFESIELVKE